MATSAPPLLISLKPNYADLVFKGLKTAELRRRLARHLEDRDVYVYVSSPVRQLRGGFRIGQVWSGAPEEIWEMVSDLAGVSEAEFATYYQGSKIAYALEILDVWEFAEPPSLARLRTKFPKFVVPQSYRYVRPQEIRSFCRLKRLDPHNLGALAG